MMISLFYFIAIILFNIPMCTAIANDRRMWVRAYGLVGLNFMNISLGLFVLTVTGVI